MSSSGDLSKFNQLIVSIEPPELGPGPRAGVVPLAELEKQIEVVLATSGLGASARDLVRATVLLWHDHLDAAHIIAQAVENADGGYVHGIMHRREPDYGNAKYWFRRVGQHACFATLADRAAVLLKSKGQADLGAKVIVSGQWDAYAFIDACERAASRSPSDPQTQLLRALQALEFENLLEYLAGE